MAAVSNSIRFTTREFAYLSFHTAWRFPELPKFVAVCIAESQLVNGEYRPESANPSGGRDMGAAMINDKWQPTTDPFVRFDPITACRHAREIWSKSAFTPWSYPGKKTDTNLNLAAVTAEIGTDPYNIANSPYWRMRKAGINTWDLPVPPADVYVSTLPLLPVKYGTGGLPPSPVGITINQLQRIGQSMGRFSGGLDHWYGPRVAAFIASIQLDLMQSGLWTGLTDGRAYTGALRDVWDGVLEASFHFSRGSL